MLTVELIKSIQRELFCEDVEVDWVTMLSWSEEEVREYFTRGGLKEAPTLPSKKDFLDALNDEKPAPPADISDLCPPPAAEEPPPPPRQKKFMRPSDYANTPEPTQAERRKGYLPGVHNPRSVEDEDAEEAAAAKKREPLPALPGTNGVMTVDEAYDFLGVAREDRGNLEKLKARFRKMCLKWHPDKNRGREKEAASVFEATTAAYHFLTTNNFDYKRWKQSFTIPPMQSLDEVLLMALSGEDPYNIEQLLRKRGEYRPHKDFGINLSIPWNAGAADDPSYDVGAGSQYTTTKGLENGPSGSEPVKELGSTAGADDEAYAMALDELVSRGADLAKLRKMALADASGADLRNELKRLGYMRLGERSRAVSALKAAANGRVASDGDGKKKKGSGSGGDGWDSLSSPNGLGGSSPDSCKKLATIANEAALLNELAVVEAPRVRELGLYKSHNDMYIERFGKQAELGANDSARPWEAIAVGREYHEPVSALDRIHVQARTYTSITPGHERAHEFAEKANDQAMQAYRDKDYQLCYDAATEAIRLNHLNKAYYGNRAAAALKLRGQSHLRTAVDDCKAACAIDPGYVKGYVRSAEAHFAMGEPHTVAKAIEMYEKALQLEPGCQPIIHALERVRMIYSSDYVS